METMIIQIGGLTLVFVPKAAKVVIVNNLTGAVNSLPYGAFEKACQLAVDKDNQ